MIASTRSLHQAGVRAEHQHDGRAGSGRATKRFDVGGLQRDHESSRAHGLHRANRCPLRRNMHMPLRSGDEKRREARADVLGDHLGGAVLGVALRALAREALLLAGMS